jgi:hypothetical protein
MTFRFYRRRKLFPGLRVNVSKQNVSLSIGRPGAWITAGTRGARVSLGAPGTGLGWYQENRWRRPVADAGPPKPQLSVRGAIVCFIGIAIAFFGLLIWCPLPRVFRETNRLA